MSSPAQKREELAALLNEVRARVASKYPLGNAIAQTGSGTVTVPLPDLMPLVHARDAAQAKIAAIGSVNPRPGGIANRVIQFSKRAIARSLNWFVRDQVVFNREAVMCTEATLQALNEVNFALTSFAGQITAVFERHQEVIHGLSTGIAHLERLQAEVSQMRADRSDLKDMAAHWATWRPQWEEHAAQKEHQLLRVIADLQLAEQRRSSELESSFRESIRAQHADYLAALEKANLATQQKLWQDLERIRSEYERIIHTELRMIRQKAASSPAVAPPAAAQPATQEPAPDFDYQKFADKFRGPEDWVRRNQELYMRYFAGRRNVLDIGCGRGEMLEDLRAQNIPAKGIDLSAESVAYCRSKGVDAEVADLFTYLNGLADGELDGIFCSQVIEHLPPERLPEMIRLCALKLDRDGVIALETPNPECLAIFATHFYLDPTHRKPIPPALLGFYLEEAGFGRLERHALSPASELIPQVNDLPRSVVEQFFGGMDYAIIARKL